MRVLFLCGREVDYPLNQVMLRSFQKIGEVDVVAERGAGTSIIRRSLQVLAGALPRLLSRIYDLVFVGFYGQLLMLPVGLLTRRPVLFTPFISTYETLVFDRQKAAESSLTARLAFWLDQAACQRADHLLLDTLANIAYFSRTFGVPEEKFSLVRIGSDESVFYPRPEVAESPVVLYHGSYLALQGVDVVVRAARLLDGRCQLRFKMLGNGQNYARVQRLVAELGVTNMDFLPAVPLQQLPGEIARAMICLGGHFGTSDKAARVIAGKTFQDLAMGKPTIVGENAANHELLTHGTDAWFCPMNAPQSLADGIRALAEDAPLRAQMGRNARKIFLERASLGVIQTQVQQVVEAMVREAG